VKVGENCIMRITCGHVKDDEMGRACSTHGDNMNAYRILVGKPKGKRLLERLIVGGRTVLKWISQK
jgi:hypothetical protein